MLSKRPIRKELEDEDEENPQFEENPMQIYKGEWKDDMRHGYGVQEFYDGS
jgi:hypothetical protein